ncbi:MAG: cyclic nucleotide-binding domain-containing protein, partial [Pseudomonadota bacterium]
VRAALAQGAAENRPVAAVILDFRAVTGADSSARFGMTRLAEQCAAEGARLVFTGFPRQGAGDRVLGPALAEAEVFATLEQGLEACEDALLDALGADRARRAAVGAWLAEEMPPAAAQVLVARLTCAEVPPQELICRQGAPSDSMFFIAYGRVSIFYLSSDAPPLRLRTALGRTVVGEAGFFTGAPRGASVIADEKAEVWTLTREALERLKSDDPAAALALEELVIRTLADRLTLANREVAALQ